MRLPAVLSALFLLSLPGVAQASNVYVNPARAGCSDSASVTVASDAATPWCSLTPATRLARPGDVVHVAAATYATQFRPAASGTQGAPISYEADGAVTLAAPAGSVGVMLVGVHDIVLRGMSVLSAAPQGVWIDSAARIVLDGDSVTNTGGTGVQVKAGTAVTITHSRLVGNARAGLTEMAQSVGLTLSASTISGNGKDGQQYNGDGVGLNGSGGSVIDDSITGNGDGAGFEHGVYAGPTASGYLIARNQIGDNAGADIKAAGGPGVIAENRLTSSMFGLVISDNPTFVTAEYNLIQGRFQHGILVTTGATAARARLWNNTVQQTGRSTTSGNASAVFVVSAAQLELRNNLFAYTNADLLGSAFLLNDQTLVGSFVADTNWYASPDPNQLQLAWNGARVTFAKWRALSGQDANSINSAPPAFSADGHVTSANLGAAKGTPLGLTHDLAGTPLPVSAPPDIGAYQR
jgi:hypothetical protein